MHIYDSIKFYLAFGIMHPGIVLLRKIVRWTNVIKILLAPSTQFLEMVSFMIAGQGIYKSYNYGPISWGRMWRPNNMKGNQFFFAKKKYVNFSKFIVLYKKRSSIRKYCPVIICSAMHEYFPLSLLSFKWLFCMRRTLSLLTRRRKRFSWTELLFVFQQGYNEGLTAGIA